MKSIYKFKMEFESAHEMPEGAEFLSVQAQDINVCAWFLVDPTKSNVSRQFKLYGTGWEVPEKSKYLGTAQLLSYVWHLFEEL